jgi:hypothetical protein
MTVETTNAEDIPEEETIIDPATASVLERLQAAMAPGIDVRNDTPFPILFMLSQLSPLHWCKVEVILGVLIDHMSKCNQF